MTRLTASVAAGLIAASLVVSVARAQAQTDAATGLFDQVLDTYVRDGLVYYRALRSERARLDRVVEEFASVDAGRLPREARLAFWVNAYNALVLRTVIDHYPIQGRLPDYPSQSLRQVPGAFDRLSHRVAGRAMTLDDIERGELAPFHDPRVYFALGRGAVDGGRLRSEAFSPERLEVQLTAVAAECVARAGCAQVDRAADTVTVSPVFSWREADFVAAYAGAAAPVFAGRSPVERAILAFLEPRLLVGEREQLGRNTFRLAYRDFDWTLNDLTGRGR